MSSNEVEKPACRRISLPPKLSSDGFLAQAQKIVLENFNAHRKSNRVPELLLDQINVVWFAKVLGGWICNIDSTVARGLLWKITYASARNEMYLDVFTKLNNIRIPLGDVLVA